MIQSFLLAVGDLFSPPFRKVLWRSLGLTALMGVALYVVVVKFVTLPWPAAETALEIVTGIGILLGTGYFLAPVTAAFAGLFLDDIAKVTEDTHYPDDPPGRPLPMGEAILSALRFTGLVIIANLVMLVLLLVPGVNLVVFFIGNGYLIGREYFEVAAARLSSRAEVQALRRRHGLRLFLDGVVIAGVLAIPLVNLLTPLFATAFMVHEHKKLTEGKKPLGA